jgi:hypothetical protein
VQHGVSIDQGYDRTRFPGVIRLCTGAGVRIRHALRRANPRSHEALTGVAKDRESLVARNRTIDRSIDHSPSQINFIFIVLFKSNLDPGR